MDNKAFVKAIVAGNNPGSLRGGRLDFSAVKEPFRLPENLRCHTLILKGTRVSTLPAGLHVDFKVDASDCAELSALPSGLKASVLLLRNCRRLSALPENLETDYLTIENCENLAHWPESAKVHVGNVNARNCRALERLPQTLGPVTSLDLAGCERIKEIPPGVQVRSWIDVAGTKIRSLPESLSKVHLRWRGVAINAQIAFFPETIDVETILTERNAELRRVLTERVGYERFLKEVRAEVLHEDTDPGGRRELLRVPLPGDEDLVCVSVRCPSTARHYLIRVPPTMKTCHQAVAWTAGFDNPDDYQPLAET